MPDHRCVATAISRVVGNLSVQLRLPESSPEIGAVSVSMRELSDGLLTEARERIDKLERELLQQKQAVEQLQDVLQTLIEKPR